VRLALIIFFLLVGHALVAQVTFRSLLENKNFQWIADSSSNELTIYYPAESWASKNPEKVKERLLYHYQGVKSFLHIETYRARINVFIVDSRAQMKKLVGHETNGSAFHDANTLTGIASEKMNSLYSNHELFHIMAMNIWGVPGTWINEGMAVYSDNAWHGHDLYQLTKYLVDHNRYVPLEKLITDFRKADDRLSYPLAGSFVKYLDETYGRQTVEEIWKGKRKDITRLTGKSLKELEQDWLTRIRAVDYGQLKY